MTGARIEQQGERTQLITDGQSDTRIKLTADQVGALYHLTKHNDIACRDVWVETTNLEDVVCASLNEHFEEEVTLIDAGGRTMSL